MGLLLFVMIVLMTLFLGLGWLAKYVLILVGIFAFFLFCVLMKAAYERGYQKAVGERSSQKATK